MDVFISEVGLGCFMLPGPERRCRALSGVQIFPQPLGSDGDYRSPRELVCAALPKTNVKANTFSRSTYTPKLWFVFLRWGYREEKFLIVHLKKKGTVKTEGDLILSSHAPFATDRSVRGLS